MTVAEQLCDRVAFINDGVISAIDSPQKLMIDNGNATVNLVYRLNGQLLNAVFPIKGLYKNHEFVNLLKSDSVVSMHSKEATLEDVFIKLTGRELA